MTEAEKIATQFQDDGQVFESPEGSIFDVCERSAVSVDQNWEREATRITRKIAPKKKTTINNPHSKGCNQ